MKAPSVKEIKKSDYDKLVSYCDSFGLDTKGKAAYLRERLIEHVKKKKKRTKRDDGLQLENARLQMRLNLPRDALITLENIKRKDKFYWLEKGNCHVMLDQPEEALRCYDIALAGSKNFKPALIAKQNLLMAVAKYGESLKINLSLPEDMQNILQRIIILQNSNKCIEVLRFCDDVLERNELEYVSNLKGMILMKFEKFAEALECFERALATNEEYAEAWSNKGICLSKLGLIEEADEALKKALELNPQYAAAWNNRGILAYNSKKLDNASIYLEEALELMESSESWVLLGLIHSKKSDLDQALKCFDRALELDSTYAEAWNNKGLVLRKMKKYLEAKRCFEKAMILQPGFEEAEKNFVRIRAK